MSKYNACEECYLLETDDFLLVLQTQFQRDMLIRHGCKGVCMDATYNVNEYDFHLITVIVIDEYQEGVPVAWALCNCEDKIALKYYILQSIKIRCGNFKSSSDKAP